jgi:ferritin-like metal-binding protein YciE
VVSRCRQAQSRAEANRGWLSVCPGAAIKNDSNSIMEKNMKDLTELFLEELADIYDAEKQLVKALPKMVGKANAQELQTAFEDHLEQTEQHVQRLERVFQIFDMKAKGKKCEAMEGLIEEAEEIMKEEATPSVMDAALIAAAQKVEHYEIATYGCLRTWAELLGKDEALDLLEETLNEEKDVDESLTDIATNINQEANEGEAEEEEAHGKE